MKKGLAMAIARNIVPLLGRLPKYRKESLRNVVVAVLSTSAVVIPGEFRAILRIIAMEFCWRN
jgi:hypothetical protein